MSEYSRDEILDSSEKKQYTDEELAGFRKEYAKKLRQSSIQFITAFLVGVVFVLIGAEFLLIPTMFVWLVVGYVTFPTCPACNAQLLRGRRRTLIRYCDSCGIHLWERGDPAMLDSSEDGTAIQVIEYEGQQVQVVRKNNEQYYARIFNQYNVGGIISTAEYATEEQAIEAAKTTIRIPLG